MNLYIYAFKVKQLKAKLYTIIHIYVKRTRVNFKHNAYFEVTL